MLRHSISKRRMLVGTRWTPSNLRRPFSKSALRPFPSDLRVARAVDNRHVPAGPLPPFMVSPKGTTREAGLEWLPTL
jgi:hypothetical protein